MPKRKPVAPRRVDEEKRQCLSWNMMDMAASAFVANGSSSDNQSVNHKEHGNLLPIGGNSSLNNHDITSIEKDETDKDLQGFLDCCHFYLSIGSPTSYKVKDAWSCHLGTFAIEFKSLDDSFVQALKSTTEFWFYVSRIKGRSMLYVELTEVDENFIGENANYLFSAADSEFPYACLEALKTKVFKLELERIDQDLSQILVKIQLLEGGLIVPHFASEGTRPKKTGLALQQVMEQLHKFTIPDYSAKPMMKKLDIEHLYDVIRNQHLEDNHRNCDEATKLNVQHPSLIPLLRPYQKSAVRWMLSKEKYEHGDDDIHQRAQVKNGFPNILYKDGICHSLWEEFQTGCQQTLYYNRFSGSVTKGKQFFVESPPGGILADEMGLGKTIEVLACMLLHPRHRTAQAPNEAPTKDMNVPKHDTQAAPMPKKNTNAEEQANVQREANDNAEEGVTGEPPLTGVFQEHNYVLENGETAGCILRDILQGTVTIKNHEATYISEQVKAVATSEDESQRTAQTENDQQSIANTLSTRPPEVVSVTDTIDATESDHRQLGGSENAMSDNSKDFSINSDHLSNDRNSLSASGTQISEPWINDTVCGAEQMKDNVCEKDGPGKCISGTSRLDLKEISSNGDAGISGRTEQVELGREGKSPNHKQYFGCICGMKDTTVTDKVIVECRKCGILQHPECVNFDLSRLLTHPYLCPHCLVSSKPEPSGATLIISPNSICHQWVEEIGKHIRQSHLKVFVYTGVTKQGFLQPTMLADHDIVITTYETLRKEIDYVDLPHTNSADGRKFRHPKRFMAVPSPITAIEWWRICLDEAQMVECTTTKTAEMALRLSAVNRWCVTGTPIQKSIDDLYGLVLFLRLDPYWVRHWWTKLLYEPYCYGDQQDLNDVVGKILWRTAKKDVIEQINLPVQREEIHLLQFSPVEEHFYRRQYRDCTRLSMQKLSKWTESNIKLNSLDRQTLHQLLYPLTRLRQACCHPQAVRGEFLPINKSTMTMEELLKSLTKKAKIECEEAHRQVVAALNAQAGIFIIQQQFAEAVDRYRAVLQSVEEYKDRVRTDPLQILHTLCNLDEVLQAKHQNIAPTLRDDQLKKQATELRDKYLAKAAAYVGTSQESLLPAQRSVRQLQQQFKDGRGWWAELINWVAYINMEPELTLKIKEELSDHSNHGYNSISRRFNNLRGLELILGLQLDQLQSSREAILKSLRGVSTEPSREMVNQTVECCLRPIAEITKTCPFCKIDEQFKDYEGRLYLFIEKGTNTNSNEDDSFYYLTSSRRQGTWADGETEKALKVLLAFCRNMGGTYDKETMEFGNLHMKIFEALKKEFKCLRTVFIALKEQVSSFDELDMATMRFRLRLADEPVSDPPLPYILEEAELDQCHLKHVSDEAIGRRDLQRKLGQLLYLSNLAKTQDNQLSGSNPEPCPICQRELGEEWSVLQCGHCFCLDCIRIMVDEYSFGGQHKSLKCAICRQKNLHADISYVSTKRRQDADGDGNVKVKGDHSTKVDGVIRCLLQIQKTQPGAKALIFSTWQDVLDIIAQALDQNGIEFRSLHAQNKYQKNLMTFKHDDKVMALLLPVHSGANGLNLIEATHVLLVEPILNVAQELQAVGRVHRIGQTNPTVVHRFLVQGTIEPRMNDLLKTVQTTMNSHNNEETMLTIGDLASLFQETELDACEEEIAVAQTEGIQREVQTLDIVENENGINVVNDTACAHTSLNDNRSTVSAAQIDIPPPNVEDVRTTSALLQPQVFDEVDTGLRSDNTTQSQVLSEDIIASRISHVDIPQNVPHVQTDEPENISQTSDMKLSPDVIQSQSSGVEGHSVPQNLSDDSENASVAVVNAQTMENSEGNEKNTADISPPNLSDDSQNVQNTLDPL